MRAAESRPTWQPALDGVRAVAVLLVLLFHAGFSWMSGGYLGVSVFFTLSGFLITRLLLTEHATTGGVAFGAFASRRIRRLLPASLVCLLLIMGARATGEFAAVVDLRRDIVGALAQVFNWVRLAGSGSYSELFAGATAATISPLEHYWSLAIEEQFYLIWPVALVGIIAIARRRGSGALALTITMVTLGFAVIAPIIAALFGSDAAYWATPARLAEILAGASVAGWIAHRGQVAPRLGKLAAPMLVVVIVAASVLAADSGPAYAGLLPIFAVASALLIVGLQVPGPITSLLSAAPLVWLGSISYGVYLFHWPVFTIARQHGWTLTELPSLVAVVTFTLGLAWASAAFVERPIRKQRWSLRPTLGLAAAAVALTALGVGLVPDSPGLVDARDPVFTAIVAASTPAVDSLAPRATDPAGTAPVLPDDSASPLPTSLVLPPAPSRPVRILVVGDSTALAFAHGLAVWATTHPQYASVSVVAHEGFGVLLSGTIANWDGAGFIATSRRMIETEIPGAIDTLQPDVIVVMTTVDDVTDRRWTDDEGVLSPSDSLARSRLATAYHSFTDDLLERADGTVVWVVPPTPTSAWESRPMREPERYLVQHDIIRALPTRLDVRLFDLEEWMAANDLADNDAWRPDGTHLSTDASLSLANQLAGPWLVEVAVAGG